ncbi:MAG: hypothetical protein ABIR66_01170 [Saprospiraceae bacterium]
MILETSGKIRPRKYPAGSEIRVHFKGEPRLNWMRYTIWSLDLKSNCIQVSDTYCLPLKDLDGFDLSPENGNKLATLSGKFFLQWSLFSAVQAVASNISKVPIPHLGAFHFIVAGSAAAVWLYSKLFLNGQKKLNRNHRLKLIDLTLEKPKA